MSYEGFSSYITQGNSAVKSKLRYDASTGKFTVGLSSNDNDFEGFYVFDGRDFPTLGMSCLRDAETGIPTADALTPLHYDSEGKLAGYLIANITGYHGTFNILGVRGQHPVITPVFVRYDSFYDQSNPTPLSWPTEVAAIEVWDDTEVKAYGGATVGSTPPPKPQLDDIWTDTSNPLLPVIRRWNGGAWTACFPEVFEVINGVVTINVAAIAQVSAGAIQTGNLRALNLATGSRLYHPDYPNTLFQSVEYATSGLARDFTWNAGTAWSFNEAPAATMHGPGATGSPKFCPDATTTCTFLVNTLIVGYEGVATLYMRLNGGQPIALDAFNSAGAGSNTFHMLQRRISGLAPTDVLSFYSAPCDGNGNIATNVTTQAMYIEATSFNW